MSLLPEDQTKRKKLRSNEKIWSKSWTSILPLAVDPSKMYVHVSEVKIQPTLAQNFLRYASSSESFANDTGIFTIEENDSFEKTGNVSFFIELAAFN